MTRRSFAKCSADNSIVKRNGIVSNELLLWYNFDAKTSRLQFAPISTVSRAKEGLSPNHFFLKFSLYGNGLSSTGFKSKINNCTFEKITFENVGNLICPVSRLTSTSSRRSPEGKHWLNLTVSLLSNATIATKVSCKHLLVKTIGKLVFFLLEIGLISGANLAHAAPRQRGWSISKKKRTKICSITTVHNHIRHASSAHSIIKLGKPLSFYPNRFLRQRLLKRNSV